MKRKFDWMLFIRAFIVAFSVFLLTTASWLMVYFNDLTMDKIIFHLKVPMGAGADNFYGSAALFIGLPTLAAFLLTYFILKHLKKTGNKLSLPLIFRRSPAHRRIRVGYSGAAILFNVAALVMTGVSLGSVNREFQFSEFLRNQTQDSPFIEEHYQPSADRLTFPAVRRNLIYIYLESMENTFSSEAEGGAFPENYIPELTEIARTNISFSNSDRLGGNVKAVGTGWTMAAMFAHSTGLPLKIPVGQNDMSQFASFFPGAEALGDVLSDHGYKNYLMIGSEVEFGGRKLFFTQHGEYEIMDYKWAIKEERIPKDYKVWWGLEDQKLFAMAREELQRIARGPEPFNFTMLTVDTHHVDGYLCDLCEDEFSEQYANVLACSSRQVSEFLDWIRTQDFYENTTVVLVGDHQTMDPDFCDPVSPDYERTSYNAFINVAPGVVPVRTDYRRFSAWDYYPTTLASLGVTLEGDRLGLGTNLFSARDTLLEQYGRSMMPELSRQSDFYDQTFMFQP